MIYRRINLGVVCLSLVRPVQLFQKGLKMKIKFLLDMHSGYFDVSQVIMLPTRINWIVLL